MKKTVYIILNFLSWVATLPFVFILSPYIWYKAMTGKELQLKYLLTFGRSGIGGYDGKLKVGTNKNNIIYETDDCDLFWKLGVCVDGKEMNIKYLLKMKVYNYWIEDDYLFVKVFKNDKLIKKHYDNYKGIKGVKWSGENEVKGE